jgi:hypothetical protein
MRFISYSTESRLLQEAATSAVRRLRSAKGSVGVRSNLPVS